MTKPKIFLLSVIKSDFFRMLELARLLKTRGFEVEFVFEERSHRLTEPKQKVKEEGFVYHSHYSEAPVGIKLAVASDEGSQRGPLAKIKILLFAKRFMSEMSKNRKLIQWFSKLISERKPTLIISPLNGNGYQIPVYHKVCRDHQLKTACLPFAIAEKDAMHKAARFAKLNQPSYLLNRWFRPFFKRWAFVSDQKYLALPAEKLMAYRFLSVKMDKPLSAYGSHVDALFVDNEYMKRHVLEETYAAGKIEVTGSVVDDKLVAINREKEERYQALCERFIWDTNRRFLCIALPPFVKSKPTDDHLFELETLVDMFVPHALLDELKSWNVLISFHPRIDATDFEYKGAKAELAYLSESVEPYVPMCDLFVACYSSTIRLASAFNVPVVNYDVLGYQYKMLTDLDHFNLSQTQAEYQQALKVNLESEIAIPMEGNEALRGVMDGKSSDRIIAAITEMIDEP